MDGTSVDATAGRAPPQRRTYLDNVKVVLIAAIIVMHAVLGYAASIEAWSYAGVQEVTLSPATEIPLLVLVAPFGLALMTGMFLMAGLLTPPSLRRKGAAGFARGRLLRLGVPFVIYVGLLQPTVMYALDHTFGDATGSYWQEYLGSQHQLDTGPLWFVGVLLIFSLVYAAWIRWPPRPPRPPSAPVTAARLGLLAAWVAPLSFVVRLVYPYGGEAGFTDLNLWQWPACAAAFWLGIVTYRQGWADAVPPRVGRASRRITLAAAGAMAVLLAVAGFLDLLEEAMGGWSWAAVAFTAIETLISIFGAVWIMDVAQRRLTRPLPHGVVLGRTAYAAFMVQAPVLIGLAVALRPVPVIAEVKAVTVAALGLLVSFALARALLRLPGLSRVL